MWASGVRVVLEADRTYICETLDETPSRPQRGGVLAVFGKSDSFCACRGMAGVGALELSLWLEPLPQTDKIARTHATSIALARAL